MHNKTKIVFLAALFICCTWTAAFSQATVSSEFKTTLGPPYKVVDAGEKFYFNKGDEIMTLKIDGKNLIIQKLNSKDLSFVSVKEFEKFLPKGGDVEEVAEFNGKYYIFYSLWDKPHEQLFSKEIDFAKGEPVGEDKLLLKTDKKITSMGGVTFGFGGFGFVGGGKFAFNLSLDRKKMMVKYRLKPEVKDDSKSFDIIGMHVFSADMVKDWGQDVTMPYTEKKMNNLDYTLDGEGNAYMLTTVFENNTTKLEVDGKPNFHIELIQVKAKTAALRNTTVSLGDKYISKIWMAEGKGGQIVCAGYYSTRVREIGDADGIFIFNLGSDGSVGKLITHEIPVSVLNQYVSDRTKKRNERKDENGTAAFEELVLRNLIIEDDGSVVLIGEQHFVRRYTTYAGGRSSTRTDIYYNDILAAKINADGSLGWMQKLAKRQFSSISSGAGGFGFSLFGNPFSYRQGGMSYKYMHKNGSHYMLFLDNVKNLTLPETEAPKQHVDGRGGFMTAYKVDDKTGSVSKLSLFDTRDVQGTEVFQFNTDRILSISESEFVVEVYKKKKEDVLIKVTLL